MGSGMKGAGALVGVNEVGENGARGLRGGQYEPGVRGTGALVGMSEVGENGASGLREGQYGEWDCVGVDGWVGEVMGREGGMGMLECV